MILQRRQLLTASAALIATKANARLPRGASSPLITPTGVGYNKGVSVGLFNYSGSVLTNAVADIANNLGASWVRVDFPWNDMEVTEGVFNTTAWDNAVTAAVGVGLHVLGIIDYCPSWANGSAPNQFYPPTNMSDYAAFCTFLVNRYKPMGVRTWEIWNEENGSTFWQPAPSPTVYTSMLAAAYPAIKAADPQATVMIGGMATFGDDGTNYNCITFLTDLYSNGARPYFDAVAMHPYVYTDFPNAADGNNWDQMFLTSPSLRSVMIANGDITKLIWMTEMGWPNATAVNPALTETGQVTTVQQAYELQATYSWAGPLFWYTYQDGGNDPSNVQDWFGLVGFDGTDKASYTAYQEQPK